MVRSSASKETTYRREPSVGVGLTVALTTGGTTGGGGSGVAVGRTIGWGKFRATVGGGVLLGAKVAVGSRVPVGVGSAGVGVIKLGVGIKLGKVAVGVTVGDGV